MDPLSALGVAAAAVGFFDCAVGLIKMYRQMRARGDPDMLHAIRKTAEDLAAARKALMQRPSRTDLSAAVSENEQALDELFNQCDKIVNRLLAILDSLEGKAKGLNQLGRPARLDTFSRALKTFWKADELEDLDAQLAKFRGQLAFRLLAVLNAKLDFSSDQQTERFDRVDKKGDEIVDVLAIHHQSLVSKLEEHARGVASANRDLIEAILTLRDGSTTSVVLDNSARNHDNTALLDNTLRSNNAISIRSPRDMHPGELGIGSLENVASRILSCLNFRQMKDRFESIPEAHAQTLQWIFDPPKTAVKWDNFPAWLESGTGCYWINGKAGSGKSTLMKFLWAHPTKSAHLERWSKGRPLIMASFFFWYMGSSLQKSQIGLLRSLLYDILSEAPSLIPMVMPDLCREVTKRPDDHLGEPSIVELTRWFKNLACHLPRHQQARFCLFIDGLDEFAGDHPDLADFLVDIASKSNNMKLVISSRPLTAFTEAFQDAPSLHLQDLTENDIRGYTDAMLRKKFSSKLGDEWTTFLDEIVTKSAGVFLWVSLVVKSLLSGLRDGDTVMELRARLDELPSDLKDLYQHMLDRIPKNYRLQASEIFQILLTNVLARSNAGLMPHLTLLELAFALDKSVFPFGTPIQPIPRRQKKQMASDTEVRLRARCLGIFEVRHLSRWLDLCNAPVDFIHKTAVEFLSTENVVKTLGSPVGFNPFTSLFQACLWMGRTIPITKRPTLEEDQEIWRYLRQGLEIASMAEINGTPIPPEYIVEMDRLYTTRWDAAVIYWVSINESKPIPRPSSWITFMFDNPHAHDAPTTTVLAPDSLFASSGDILNLLIHSDKTSPPNQRIICKPLTLLVGIRYALLSFCRHALSLCLISNNGRAASAVPTLCLEFFIQGLALGAFDFLSTPAGTPILSEICNTLFQAGADPNSQLDDPVTLVCKGTPWTVLAATLFCEYYGGIRIQESQPSYALWEAVVKVFVDNGARTDAAIDTRAVTASGGDPDASPLSSQLERLRPQNSTLAQPWQQTFTDSVDRIRDILESPLETRNPHTGPPANGSKGPKEVSNPRPQATQAGDVQPGHVPKSDTFELRYEEPLSLSTWFHDTLRLLLCCKRTRRG